MKKITLIISAILFSLTTSNGCSSGHIELPNDKKQEEEHKEEDTEVDLSPIYFSLDKGAQETVKVYVQVYDSLYAMFRVVHEINLDHFKNLWRIKESHMYEYKNDKMIERYPILTSGENEFVWYSAREGVEEATGGYHGSERIDIDPNYGSIEFVADGQAIDLSKTVTLTAAESFHYIQRSTMHQTGTGGLIGSPGYVPVPGNPLECYHEKRTVFEDGGYTTYNKLEWADNNTPVLRSYFGLFCVTPNVSKEGYSEDGSHVTFNDDGGMKLVTEGTKIVMLNNDLNIKVTCDSRLVQPQGYKTTTMIWDRNVYHKYYNRVGGGGVTINTMQGDKWEAEASIHFEKIY